MEGWAAQQKAAAVELLVANAQAAEPVKAGGLQFVFGNDAGDMDSVVSALGAAFLLATVASTGGGGGSKLVCPLITFRRDEFRLRGDSVALFKAAGWTFDAPSLWPMPTGRTTGPTEPLGGRLARG